jgi:integrase
MNISGLQYLAVASNLARSSPGSVALAVDVDALRQEAKRLVEPPHARETRRRYSREVRTFREFCRAIGAEPLPASPDTVVLYLAQMKAQGRTAGGIDAALTAISTFHRAAGHDSPRASLAVATARENIRREIGAAPKKKAPMRLDRLRAAVEAIPVDTLLGKRDRAILLLGFAGAFRRSELVGLDARDWTFCPEGARVLIRKSKTDQGGRGKVKAIPSGAPGNPVAAVRAWIDAANLSEGPLFRAVDRWGHVGAGRLDGRTVARVVKRALAAAGCSEEEIREYAGHSLRGGLATEAAAQRKARHKIQAQTGHASGAMLDQYINDAEIFRDNAADDLGWREDGEG